MNEENIDTSIIDDESVRLTDGIDSLAKILGGIALVAAENKKMLQSKDPSIVESAVKSAGVLGASLVGIGSSIAKFAARNSDIAERK
jgi:hypothetical protein